MAGLTSKPKAVVTIAPAELILRKERLESSISVLLSPWKWIFPKPLLCTENSTVENKSQQFFFGPAKGQPIPMDKTKIAAEDTNADVLPNEAVWV